MFNKSEPLETYPFEGLGETHWDETGCSVDAWNPFQTGETGFFVQFGQGLRTPAINLPMTLSLLNVH